MNWQSHALCVGRWDLFYAPTEDVPGRSERKEDEKVRESQAKALCARCPVRLACRDAGLDEPYGIWGGLTERERGNYQKRRAMKRPREVVYTQRWLSV